MVAGGFGVGLVDDEGLCAGSHRGNNALERARAVRQVATLAKDAGECARLLDMLGLTAEEGRRGHLSRPRLLVSMISVRLSPVEAEAIREAASGRGVTVSAFLRESALAAVAKGGNTP